MTNTTIGSPREPARQRNEATSFTKRTHGFSRNDDEIENRNYDDEIENSEDVDWCDRFVQRKGAKSAKNVGESAQRAFSMGVRLSLI
jgi:hypothetical protein